MTTYIAAISDAKVRDLLIKLKKEDTLVLYYKPDEKQVPIDMISLFSETKGQVEFREYSDDVTVAFEIGRLAGGADQKNNAGLEIASGNNVFGKIKALLAGSKKAKKPSARKASATKKTEPVPEQLSFDMIAPVETEKLFDEAYSRFDSLLASLKTKAYNPVTGKQGIFNALKLMQEEGQTFEEALKKTLPASSARKFFAEISPENIERIKEAGLEVMKYDQ